MSALDGDGSVAGETETAVFAGDAFNADAALPDGSAHVEAKPAMTPSPKQKSKTETIHHRARKWRRKRS
jgi:hypothetical protein